MKIEVSEELHRAWPGFRGAAVFATVRNTAYNAELWKRIEAFTALYREKYTLDPSSEALCRRILRGIPLYQIDTLVDLINLASIYSGNSIGGFDRDKIQGDRLVLGIGKAGEPYEGIGRGELNIEGMPVYRDAVGGIGTPTSDHERTKMSLDTTHVLAIMNAYGGSEGLADSVNYMVELMKEFAEAHDIEIIYFE